MRGSQLDGTVMRRAGFLWLLVLLCFFCSSVNSGSAIVAAAPDGWRRIGAVSVECVDPVWNSPRRTLEGAIKEGVFAPVGDVDGGRLEARVHAYLSVLQGKHAANLEEFFENPAHAQIKFDSWATAPRIEAYRVVGVKAIKLDEFGIDRGYAVMTLIRRMRGKDCFEEGYAMTWYKIEGEWMRARILELDPTNGPFRFDLNDPPGGFALDDIVEGRYEPQN